MSVRVQFLAIALMLAVALIACGGSAETQQAETEGTPAEDAGVVATAADPPQQDEATVEPPQLPGQLLQPARRTWDEMFERRVIRALVTYSQTNFFFDQGRQRGIAADAFVELEKHLNATLDVGARKMHIAAIPVNRDQLIPYLAEGRADIAVANLTITPEREAEVDFTVPTSKAINEVVVTGPGAPALASLDDLAGKAVYVRRSSSFWDSLERLNQDFTDRGLAPIELQAADEYLETEDILEMVNAGLVEISVADGHIAGFWADVFPDLVVHEDLKVAEGQHIAWAVRKDATGLKQQLNPWIEANRQGQLLGNMLLKKYLQSNPWVKNATGEAEREKFLQLVDLFRKYGQEYDLNPVMVAAQGYQESGLDQSKRSHVGAIGVMQVMPATANDPAVGIPNIHELEANIHAGAKYLRHLIDQYFDDPGIDPENRLLFAFAGYNAGPNRINRLRKQAETEGLDPDKWFRNVELVVAREVGREPVQYVANIYKYYVAYSLVLKQQREREEAA